MTAETIVVVGVVMLIASCQNPCRQAMLVSAYEAESLQCVRLAETEEEAYECFEEVDNRYEHLLSD